MSTKIIKTIIQLRRATTTEWDAYKNEIPAVGEPCFDITKNTLKIGNGVDTYENLNTIGGAGRVEADGKSIILDGDVLKLIGFDAAEIGAQPIKGANNKIEWKVTSTSNLDDLQSKVDDIEANYTTVLDKITKLENKMDGTGEGSVNEKIENYCNSNVVCGIKVDGTILDTIDGIVEIPIAGQGVVVKGSDEITIADDGALGIAEVCVSKIVQDTDTILILDCNG